MPNGLRLRVFRSLILFLLPKNLFNMQKSWKNLIKALCADFFGTPGTQARHFLPVSENACNLKITPLTQKRLGVYRRLALQLLSANTKYGWMQARPKSRDIKAGPP